MMYSSLAEYLTKYARITMQGLDTRSGIDTRGKVSTYLSRFRPELYERLQLLKRVG